MKTSYFNPEVHSFTFRNFDHVVCGVSWGFQCGGMCCMALSKFYKNKLIDCESVRKGLEDDIWNRQVGIIGSDIYKSCRWGKSLDAIEKISENIDIGKPTLLYLDLKDYDLVNDHFVIAYAMDDISDTIKRIYIYDPNHVYKRHYCNNPAKIYCIDPAYPGSTLRNFESYLEVNFQDETVTLNNGTVLNPVPVPMTVPVPVPVPAPVPKPVLGFKWYGQDETGIPVSHYTDERNIQHSCNITLISNNPPEILTTKPLISHTIMISKDGNVPADLKLWWEGGKDLFESGNNLFPEELKSEFNSVGNHIGLQSGINHIDKTYKVYQKFAPSSPPSILLQSNFIEKRLQLAFTEPAIETFTAFCEGTTCQRKHYYADYVNNQIIKLQGLNKYNVEEVAKVPEGFDETLPENSISVDFAGDDWQSAINNGSYSLFEPVFFLGYVKSKVVIELTHNGLYTDAKVRMTSDSSSSIEHDFTGNAVTFTLPEGTIDIFNLNTLKILGFEIKGRGISVEFSESFSANLDYRCLIIHEPLINQPHITDFDVFSRYFEKLLINIPHSYRIPELENRFNLELAKHPGMDREKFKELFCKQLINRFVNKNVTFWNRKRLYRNFKGSFHSYNNFRKERIDFILNKSKTFHELKQNFEILEDQMRPLIGKALLAKKPFTRVIRKLLKSEWK